MNDVKRDSSTLGEITEISEKMLYFPDRAIHWSGNCEDIVADKPRRSEKAAIESVALGRTIAIFFVRRKRFLERRESQDVSGTREWEN